MHNQPVRSTSRVVLCVASLVTFLQAFSIMEVKAAVGQAAEASFVMPSCIIDGLLYKQGERIPRDNPCHLCLCLQGEVQCAWQDCPLPPEGCSEMTFTDMCNPSLYLCPIPESLGAGRNRFVRNSDIKPETIDIRTESSAACIIAGVPYETGDVVGVASHHCLECRCGRQDLYCSPRCCFRWSSYSETPGQIMRALRIGSKVPALHPLHHLVETVEDNPL